MTASSLPPEIWSRVLSYVGFVDRFKFCQFVSQNFYAVCDGISSSNSVLDDDDRLELFLPYRASTRGFSVVFRRSARSTKNLVQIFLNYGTNSGLDSAHRFLNKFPDSGRLFLSYNYLESDQRNSLRRLWFSPEIKSILNRRLTERLGGPESVWRLISGVMIFRNIDIFEWRWDWRIRNALGYLKLSIDRYFFAHMVNVPITCLDRICALMLIIDRVLKQAFPLTLPSEFLTLVLAFPPYEDDAAEFELASRKSIDEKNLCLDLRNLTTLHLYELIHIN